MSDSGVREALSSVWVAVLGALTALGIVAGVGFASFDQGQKFAERELEAYEALNKSLQSVIPGLAEKGEVSDADIIQLQSRLFEADALRQIESNSAAEIEALKASLSEAEATIKQRDKQLRESKSTDRSDEIVALAEKVQSLNSEVARLKSANRKLESDLDKALNRTQRATTTPASPTQATEVEVRLEPSRSIRVTELGIEFALIHVYASTARIRANGTLHDLELLGSVPLSPNCRVILTAQSAFFWADFRISCI